MKEREENYDLLRIVSAVAVIMIHVSSIWFGGAITGISGGLSITDIQSPVLICIYNSISRFAVPCFIMLSGAFILDNDKNAEYKNFYAKSFAKLGVPAIIFSVLYALYRLPQYCGLDEKIVDNVKGIAALLRDILKGSPMYHMWYLYVLIGVYALAPIVLRFKNSISDKSFYKISFIFLVLANISHWSIGEIKLQWDVGQAFEYLGYFMTGYSVRKLCRRKSNAKALLMIFCGLLFELFAAGLEYREIMAGIAEGELKYRIVEPYCPLIVPASVLIFYGFTLLDVKKGFTALSGLTFYIYLIHVGVLNFIINAYWLIKGGNFWTELDGAVWIPIFVVIVFVVSVILSKIYLWLWAKIDREKRVTNWLARVVRLQGNVD